jgi:alpha-beta hydrolase superfamily lysophospholipase
LDEDKYILGSTVKNGICFSRRYIKNIHNTFLRLYYTNIKPVDTDSIKIIANLCIVHGFGHYSGEFYELAYNLAKNGINCHLIDLRGHGYSGGMRMDWLIEELHSDVLTLIKECEMDGVDLPTFIFGHSMGGGLVSSLFINNQYLQVNGVILSAPLLSYPINTKQDKFKNWVLNKIGNDINDFVCHGSINPTDLCKDDREIARLINDKRILPLASPRTMRSLLKNCERILENCK